MEIISHPEEESAVATLRRSTDALWQIVATALYGLFAAKQLTGDGSQRGIQQIALHGLLRRQLTVWR